jgi:MFS family permease
MAPGADRTATSTLFLSLHLPAAALGLGQGISTPVLPVFAAEVFGVSVGIAALVFVFQMLGGLVTSIPIGYAIDRFGRRRFLLAGPVITAASLLLTAFATSDHFWLLLVYRFIGGSGQQMWQLSRLTVIADTGGRSRARQITSLMGVQRVGMLAGPLIGGFAAVAWDLRVAFVMHAVVALAAVIPSFFVVRETAPKRPPKRADDAKEEGVSWRSLLAPPVPTLYAAQFLGTLTRGGAIGGGTIFLFAVYVYGTGPATLGVLSSITALAGIPLTLSAGYLMDRFGRKVTIVPGTLLFAASMAYLATVAAMEWPFWTYIVGFVWMQLLAAGLAGSMQTVGTDIAPIHARGRFFGIGRMVSQAGFMANPLSFTVLTSISGFTAAFAFFGGTGVAAALILALLIKETLHRNEGDEGKPDPKEDGKEDRKEGGEESERSETRARHS